MHEETVQSRTVFKGRLLCVEVADVALENGVRTTREIIRHPGAVMILAECGDGRFVLVRQYRKAVDRELLEVVAGTLEPGEDPSVCARRELQEETGRAALELTALGTVVPAPGYSAETLYAFHARVDDGGAATPDPDEQVESVVLSAAEIDRLIADGSLTDGKTLALWVLCRARGIV